MISRRFLIPLAIMAAALVLSACPGNDENSVQSGLAVHFAAVHSEALPGVMPAAVGEIANSAAVQGGYDEDTLEHHDIADGAGHVLSLYRMYLVLDDIELVPCASLAQLPRRLLNGVIATAEAHAGHGSEPVGGRALDKPNVIDIVTQDEFILPLGDAAVAPGRYCGLRVSLARLAGEAYGKPDPVPASSDDPITVPEVPDLSGKLFALRADYCAEIGGAGTCARRAKVDVSDEGLVNPLTRSIDFAQPLVVNATLREAYVAVGIAYGDWLRDVDVSHLSGNAAELQKLLNNIAGSLHIHDQGLGDLPINTAP